VKPILLLIFMILAGFAAAEDRLEGVSSSGKIGWHVVKSGDGAEVRISEADQAESAAQKLCDVISVSQTKVTVSRDDEWIIVSSGSASLGTSLSAFRRKEGMLYEEQKSVDIGGAVLLFACGGDQREADAAGRVFVEALKWSADGKSLLVEIRSGGKGNELKSFLAIYHLTTGKVGFDLEKFNSNGGKGSPH
jgi:hypothetical protein